MDGNSSFLTANKDTSLGLHTDHLDYAICCEGYVRCFPPTQLPEMHPFFDIQHFLIFSLMCYILSEYMPVCMQEFREVKVAQ